MSARVTVVGDKKVIAGLTRSAGELSMPAPALHDAADAVARAAGRYAAKRTGRLARSNRGRVAGNVATVTNRVKYAPYQEYGTRYMSQHPFMRPAVASTDLEPIFEDYTERVLRRNL